MSLEKLLIYIETQEEEWNDFDQKFHVNVLRLKKKSNLIWKFVCGCVYVYEYLRNKNNNNEKYNFIWCVFM